MLSPTTADKKRAYRLQALADKNLVPAPNGTPEQNAEIWCFRLCIFKHGSTMLMSYHELKFCKLRRYVAKLYV